MTTTAVHQCFRCELRFPNEAELEGHLQVDHLVDLRHPADRHEVPPAARGCVAVAVTPSVPVQRAGEAAWAIADQAGMAVEVVEVDEPGFTDASHARYLQACTDRARGRGLTTVHSRRLARADDGVAATLLAHLDGAAPTFAALLTRRHSALGDIVLGSVSLPVTARSPVPVLLSHPNLQPDTRYHRVVVGVDGSALAERAVRPALDLARRLGGTVSIVHVIDPDAAPDDLPEAGYVHLLADRFSSEDVDLTYAVLHGTVHRSLLRYAEADQGTILVVGSHGRTGSRLGSLGSTSRRIVHLAADAPVLVVGPCYAG